MIRVLELGINVLRSFESETSMIKACLNFCLFPFLRLFRLMLGSFSECSLGIRSGEPSVVGTGAMVEPLESTGGKLWDQKPAVLHQHGERPLSQLNISALLVPLLIEIQRTTNWRGNSLKSSITRPSKPGASMVGT